MTKIDFYLIPEQTENERFRFACRLLDKAYSQKNKIYTHVADDATSHTFYDLLWTFRDISFVPHDVVGGKDADKAPIVIGFAEKPHNQNDVLLNLNPQIPAYFAEFNRVVEIISQNEETKKLGRQHYKYYQEQNLEIEMHDLR